jgi:hypothetical protein
LQLLESKLESDAYCNHSMILGAQSLL